MADFFSAERSLGVCVVHLTSGEDVIGDVYEKDVEQEGGRPAYIVHKPVLPNIAGGQDANGQPTFRVGLLPLRPYLGNVAAVEIFTAHVMYILPVNPQMEKLYREFTSNIQLVDATQMPKGPLSLIRE